MNGATLRNGPLVLAITVICAITLFTRAFPFLFFSRGKNPPSLVLYLGRVLPPAVIALLVIYSLKDTALFRSPFFGPEVIACALVLLFQQWKRNAMISIGLGTLAYMAMIQWVFRV